ncbi:hypothetical protein MTR67_013147, partial [Solanum verrucosum]
SREFSKTQDNFDYNPILTLQVKGNDFISYYDVLHSSLSVVLIHKRNVIIYASRQLEIIERNYPSHDLELAAVVFSLKCKIFTKYYSLHHVFT